MRGRDWVMGSGALGISAPGLVPLGDRVGDREAGDRGEVASPRIPALLAVSLPSSPERPTPSIGRTA